MLHLVTGMIFLFSNKISHSIVWRNTLAFSGVRFCSRSIVVLLYQTNYSVEGVLHSVPGAQLGFGFRFAACLSGSSSYARSVSTLVLVELTDGEILDTSEG